MLSELPSEIIYHIVSYLPAVNSVINLAQTCRHLYNVISADNYRILQAFVQSQFASIEAPPFWADAARALTSRSRAFDRRAIIARFVLPPDNVTRIGHTKTVRTDHPTLGYRPVIDSYESWYGNSWASRKEVLVWGAGADLVLRIKDFGRKHLRSTDHNTVPHNVLRRRTSGTPQDGVAWAIFNDLQGVDSWDDISSVHLLRSSESSWSDKEEVIFGRRNGSLVRMSISSEKASSKVEKRYLTGGRNLEGTDISCGSRKVLAASMDSNSIVLFRVDAEENDVPPFATLKTTAHGSARHRCSRILNDETIALGSNGEANKISIFRFSYSDVEGTNELRIDDDGEPRKAKVTVIEPLPVSHITGGNPGDVFLSGWEDSKTRLHDLRSPRSVVSIFEDTVDDSPTYSIKPVGRERFIVGSGVHALVKIFDLRMGRYNYLNAKLPETQSRTSLSRRDNSKNISIFLSNRVSSSHNRSTNLFRAPHRYRGPIYTISQPSPSSSTFYIGIEDSVIRLDMASTDDLAGKNKEWYDRNLDLGLDPHGGVDCHPLDLACYERPLPEDQGRGVRLMMQDSLWQTLEEESRGQASKSDARIPGWDQRWFQPWVSSNQKMKGPWRRPS